MKAIINDFKLVIKKIYLDIRCTHSRGFTPHHFTTQSGAGFTVIDLLIYMSIFAIVLAISIDLLFQSKTLEIQIAQNQEIDRNAQIALLEMTQTIHAAQNVTSPAVGLSAGDLYINNGTISYFADANGILERNDNGQLSNLTGSSVKVENLSFTTRAEVGQKPTVSLSFSVKSKTLIYGQTDYISRAYQTTLQLR